MAAKKDQPKLQDRAKATPRAKRGRASAIPLWASRHEYPQFTMLPNDVLTSPAFCQLTANAKILYIYMRMWAGKPREDSRFKFPFFLVAENEPQVMSRATFYRARNELIDAGFIEQTNAHKTARNTQERERLAEYAFISKWQGQC